MTALVTIGGSEAAAACGLDPYKSRVRLWAEKIGLFDPEPAGEPAEWGKRLQPLIAEAVQGRGYDVMPAPADPLYSEARPWMRASLDGYAAGVPSLASSPPSLTTAWGADGARVRGVFEAKTCGLRMAAFWKDGQVPTPYQLQVQHYMAVTGLTWALVACLVGGQRLEIRVVPRDDDSIALMLNLEEEFMEHVREQKPPDPDGSADATAVLDRMYSDADGVVKLTSRDAELVMQARKLRAALKATNTQLEEVEQRLKMRMDSREVGLLNGEPVIRWQHVERKGYTVEPTTYRRFTLR
jgi:putative phage-type endonuclease